MRRSTAPNRGGRGARVLLAIPLLLFACASYEPALPQRAERPAEGPGGRAPSQTHDRWSDRLAGQPAEHSTGQAHADRAAGRAPDSAPETWRVVSYNIRHGRGMDERVELERTAAVLRRLDPDVVALQEVDQGVARSGGEDQAARLGALLGMDHAFGAFMDYQGGRYGMAVLSRCAIRRVTPVPLPDGNEPRVALAVELERPGGEPQPLTVVNVHFDWVADDGYRFAQAREVARYLDGVDGPLVLIGDFNDHPDSRTLGLFRARAVEVTKPAARQPTFPADAPAREIDYVFVAPADSWEIGAVDVIPEPAASDHRPVLAELRLARTGAAVAAGGDADTAAHVTLAEAEVAAGARCVYEPAQAR